MSEMSETNEASPAQAQPSDLERLVMPFDASVIETNFRNVERIDGSKYSIFRVKDEYGNDAGMISYLGENEWRVFVDNFPAEKKYFSWNLPVETLEQFIADMARTGLVLVEE